MSNTVPAVRRVPHLLVLLALWIGPPAGSLRADDETGTWEIVSRPRLAVRGESLVLVDGDRTTVLLSAAPPATAESGAAVRRAHEVVQSRDGRRAVALMTIGRRTVVLPVRRRSDGRLEFARPSEVPWDARVLLSPRDDAFLLVCERDLYRPPDADRPGWNRGAAYIRFGSLSYSREMQIAPDADSHLWYESPAFGARFEAGRDFALRAIRWMSDGCLLHLDQVGDGPRAVRLRPRQDWRVIQDRRPELMRLLGSRDADLRPAGDGRLLALPRNGPHAAEILLLTVAPAPKITATLRVADSDAGLLCPAFADELDLDGDGNPEFAFFDWTGIQFHKNNWLVRVADERLELVAGPLFSDRIPVARYDPESGESRLELVRNWWSALGPGGGEVAVTLAWRKGHPATVAEERRISVVAAGQAWSESEAQPDTYLRVWGFLAGRSFASVPAARSWWAENAEAHRHGDRFVFGDD